MIARRLRLLLIATGCLLAAGCLSPLPSLNHPRGLPRIALSDTPFYPQTQYHCGPAALATALGAEGELISPEALSEQLFVPDLQGSLQVEMLAASRRQGFIPVLLQPELQSLIDTLSAGKTVLVLQNLATPGHPLWHYAVIVGYEFDRNTLVLRSGVEREKVVGLRQFTRSWNWADRWAMILLRPGETIDSINQQNYYIALAELEQTQFKELAYQAYSSAIEHWPQSEFLWTGLGNTAYQLGLMAQAEQAFTRVIRLNPGSIVAGNNLANLYLENNCPLQAKQQIERTLSHTRPSHSLYNAVQQSAMEINAALSAAESIEYLPADENASITQDSCQKYSVAEPPSIQ